MTRLKKKQLKTKKMKKQLLLIFTACLLSAPSYAQYSDEQYNLSVEYLHAGLNAYEKTPTPGFGIKFGQGTDKFIAHIGYQTYGEYTFLQVGNIMLKYDPAGNNSHLADYQDHPFSYTDKKQLFTADVAYYFLGSVDEQYGAYGTAGFGYQTISRNSNPFTFDTTNYYTSYLFEGDSYDGSYFSFAIGAGFEYYVSKVYVFADFKIRFSKAVNGMPEDFGKTPSTSYLNIGVRIPFSDFF
jgi:hypothetical protein